MSSEESFVRQNEEMSTFKRINEAKLAKSLEEIKMERKKMCECFSKLKIQTTLVFKKEEKINNLNN